MTGGEAALYRGIMVPAASWRGRRPPVQPLVEAMLAGDLGEASDLAEQFLARVKSRVGVFADLLQPAQYEIGDLWYRGVIGIDDEHRAAAILERLVAMLPPTAASSRMSASSRCLLAVPPSEQHTLGLRMLALALGDEGWDVELADPDCRPEDFGCLVERVRPRLVGISAGYAPSGSELTRMVGAARAAAVPVLVGGSAFNRVADLWRRVGATAHGADARIGTVLARRMARS
jgi:methanogenic corrinoid protein MtbC1